jgi:preprotein translocase subunit SecD
MAGCQVETTTTTMPPILEFGEIALDDEEAKWENELGRWKPATAIIGGQEQALTSDYFEDLFVFTSTFGALLLVFDLNELGSRLCEQITERLIGQHLAFFCDDNILRGGDGKPITPIVQAVITDMGQIIGLSLNEATDICERWTERH